MICSTWNNYVNTSARSRETFFSLDGSSRININGRLHEEAGGGVFQRQQGAAI